MLTGDASALPFFETRELVFSSRTGSDTDADTVADTDSDSDLDTESQTVTSPNTDTTTAPQAGSFAERRNKRTPLLLYSVLHIRSFDAEPCRLSGYGSETKFDSFGSV